MAMTYNRRRLVRVCIRCGAEFSGKNNSAVCDACAAASRHAPTLVRRTCAVCGRSIVGGPTAKYCPACRAERRRAANVRQNRQGPARPLGSTDKCAECGAEYVVRSGNQRCCPACAPIVAARKVAARKAARYYAGEIVRAPRKPRYRCTECGRLIPPERRLRYTCSDACELARERAYQHAADAKRAPRKR